MLKVLRGPFCGIIGGGVGGGACAAYYKAIKTYSPTEIYDDADDTTVRIVPLQRSRPRRAIVIGAGVAGICSAYELHKNGFEVVVIDASVKGPGSECSAVAAGAMPKSNPVVDRNTWKAIVSNVFSLGSGGLGDRDFRYFYIDWKNTLTDPHFIRWSLSFAYNSLIQPKALLRQQDEMRKFTTWAIEQFHLNHDLTLAPMVEESYIASRGALILNQTQSSPSNHCDETNVQVLDTKEKIYSIEPFVKQWLPDACNAIYQPDAYNGNSERFTKSLARWLEKEKAVHFLCGKRVHKLHYEENPNRVTAIELDDHSIIELNNNGQHANDDEVVIAAGSWTPKLMWQLNTYVPVYPLKGYTLEITNEQQTRIQGILSDGVTYFSRLGNDLRIAAVGEFAGWDTSPTNSVNIALRKYIETSTGINLDGVPTRCGLRPMSSDGVVIVGKLSEWDNLSINAGPGSTGWKIALGAAKVLAHEIIIQDSDSTPAETTAFPFDQSALLPEGRVKSTTPLWSKLCLWRHA